MAVSRSEEDLVAVANHLIEHDGGAAMLYLLFAGRHGAAPGGMGSLVATFSSRDEARAAFRQVRLRLSDLEGWAELTVVADGTAARRICWFGQERRRTERPPTWVLRPDEDDVGGTRAGIRRRVRLPRRISLRKDGASVGG